MTRRKRRLRRDALSDLVRMLPVLVPPVTDDYDVRTLTTQAELDAARSEGYNVRRVGDTIMIRKPAVFTPEKL